MENQGITSAAVLHAEVCARGWTGGILAVNATCASPAPPTAGTARPGPGPSSPHRSRRRPPTRQITSWLLRRPDTLTDDEQAQLAAIRARCPHLDALAGHVTIFAQMMTRRTGEDDLEPGRPPPRPATCPNGAPRARHPHRPASRHQRLTLPWSSGTVEGTVNKIKMLKRQMYGRASFTLLRKRVILHPA